MCTQLRLTMVLKKKNPSRQVSTCLPNQPWFDKLVVVSIPKITSDKPGGLVSYLFVTNELLSAEIVDFFIQADVYTQRFVQGKEHIFNTSFPSTWTTLRGCTFLDSLCDFISSRGYKVSRRIDFPNTRPTRRPWFSREIYEEVTSFCSWCLIDQVFYEETEKETVLVILDEEDDDDNEDSLRGV